MANYKIVAEWNLPNGGIAQNVYYSTVINGETADPNDLAQDLSDEVVRILTPWLATVASNVILALLRIYVFDPLTGASTPFATTAQGIAGLGSVQSLPAGVAVKVSHYITGRARPFGVYLPGADEAEALNEGLMSTIMQAAALGTAAANTVDVTMSRTSLAYRPRAYSPRDNQLIPLLGADNEIGSVFDYQRRRKQGVGV